MIRTPVVNSRGGSRAPIHNAHKDQKVFSRTGGMTHHLNLSRPPSRGGYRM